jgi:hypothetical protein
LPDRRDRYRGSYDNYRRRLHSWTADRAVPKHQATVSVGAKVEAVHEAGEHFQVDLDEGASVQVQLADPGSSVALRDKSGAVQYLG